MFHHFFFFFEGDGFLFCSLLFFSNYTTSHFFHLSLTSLQLNLFFLLHFTGCPNFFWKLVCISVNHSYWKMLANQLKRSKRSKGHLTFSSMYICQASCSQLFLFIFFPICFSKAGFFPLHLMQLSSLASSANMKKKNKNRSLWV